MSLSLKIIIGSTRPGRGGPAVGAWVAEAAAKHDHFAAETVDLADLHLPLLDEPYHPSQAKYQHDHTKRWSAIAGAADAFVFVTPEYDFFPPATLVNAIQCLSREWRYKPAGIVSYGGISGGLRAAQELRLLVSNLSMMPLPQVVPIPFYAQSITEAAGFTPTQPVADGAALMFGELAKWATALKPMRD